ncbi:hypothetical protein F7731_18090 [Cytobacillus depressus]|uniref:Uncharacterized protein n=1 Tax=Cytobacillus depressus TaxID=1602942 RepID=A0A6L3V743_9BACI|nr:hypothetical protein [Cytobacillus depressus]KAB2331504.1 hypothetical protein F7731_18090 [Cytobacillus depressus]
MPIKGLFNQNQNNENLNKKIAELENRYLKLNALEVRVNRLAKLEEKIYPLLKWKEEMSKDKKTNGFSRQKNSDFSKELQSVEASLLRKIDPYFEKVDYLSTYIYELEKKILTDSDAKESEAYIADEEEKIAALLAYIHDLEGKISLQNDREMAMLERLDALEEKLAEIQDNKKKDEQAVVIKEIRIDKFYLDKYEQNNNFAQLGIKDLSGALNIGATYGREVMPKEVSDQLKEDLKDLTKIKEDKESQKSEQAVGESSEEAESSSDEPISFTEIPIEEESEED